MKNRNSLVVFALLFLAAILSRWAPHAWSFTVVGGVFLFSGAYFKDKKISVLLMLSSMLVSDYIIGFHDQMILVYACYLGYVLLGALLKPKSSRLKVFGYAFLASLLFYLVSNFGVWREGVLYPLNFKGLIECYIMGIPFFWRQMGGDVGSALVIFEVARVALPLKQENEEEAESESGEKTESSDDATTGEVVPAEVETKN
jgi:hypothetical protein